MERDFRTYQIQKCIKYIFLIKLLYEYFKYLNFVETGIIDKEVIGEGTEVNFKYDGRKLFTKNLKTKRVDISISKCYKTYIDIKNYIGNVKYG